MKIISAKHARYDAGPNMTPLVDVVMVILIFMMLAGSFGNRSRFLLSKQGLLGQSQTIRDSAVFNDVLLELRVERANDGVGFIVAGPGLAPTGDLEALESALVLKRQQLMDAGTPLSQIQVVLRPGERVKYDNVIAVYQMTLKAGYGKVAFGTAR